MNVVHSWKFSTHVALDAQSWGYQQCEDCIRKENISLVWISSSQRILTLNAGWRGNPFSNGQHTGPRRRVKKTQRNASEIQIRDVDVMKRTHCFHEPPSHARRCTKKNTKRTSCRIFRHNSPAHRSSSPRLATSGCITSDSVLPSLFT